MELPEDSLEELRQLEELTEVLRNLKDNLPPTPSATRENDHDNISLLDHTDLVESTGGIQQFLRELIAVDSNDFGRRPLGDVLFEIPWSDPPRKSAKKWSHRELQAATVLELLTTFDV